MSRPIFFAVDVVVVVVHGRQHAVLGGEGSSHGREHGRCRFQRFQRSWTSFCASSGHLFVIGLKTTEAGHL
jgi:hypothetical protein